MNDLYKKAELPAGLSVEPCPVCSSKAELWQYSTDFKNGPINKVVMCSNGDRFGPQTGLTNEGCLLFMPPDDFYRGRIVEAVNYWNAYAKALIALRDNAQAAGGMKPVAWKPGDWFRARNIDEMQAFFMSRLPAIRLTAREHGYAIGLHGSARRDFDLMAMPWVDGHSDRETLAHAIAQAACGIDLSGKYQWEKKPNGRYAVSICVCWTDHSNPEFKDKLSIGHIDLSVIEQSDSAGIIPKNDENQCICRGQYSGMCGCSPVKP